MKQFALILLFLSFFCDLFAATDISIKSPENKISATVSIKNGQLSYTVKAAGIAIIEPSVLGVTVNNADLGKLVSDIQLIRTQAINEQYAVRGKHSKAINKCIAYIILVQGKTERYEIEFRMFEDGCAFRYVMDNETNAMVNNEQTVFTLPAQSRVWYFERNNNWKLKSYAGLWQSTMLDSLPVVSSQGTIQGKPLIVALKNKHYLALTEAALYNYSGLRFNAIGDRRLQVNFTEGNSGFYVAGKISTPWRVIIYAKDLNTLVNTDIITNLNPAPDKKLYAQPSYIKPGRSVWSWLTRNKESDYMQPASEMRFIDNACKLGFEYTLIDEGWELKWPEKWIQLERICQYGASRNVGVWIWKHSKELMNADVRDAFLDSVKHAGAVGVKTDFMNSEAKALIDFEIGFLKACAARELMVNFHGCQAPTGESRTYPNEMTREGVRGMELNILNEPIPAWHNAALPFTRFITGHGDYTPGYFSNKANTTNVHQLAMFYLLESSFQCLADDPESLLKDQKLAPIVDLLKSLPTVWEESVVLPASRIGEIAAIARRTGQTWYVAVVNGTSVEKVFSMSASFLNNKSSYTATVFSDGANDTVKKVMKSLKSADKQLYTLLPNGGLLLEIKPLKKQI